MKWNSERTFDWVIHLNHLTAIWRPHMVIWIPSVAIYILPGWPIVVFPFQNTFLVFIFFYCLLFKDNKKTNNKVYFAFIKWNKSPLGIDDEKRLDFRSCAILIALRPTFLFIRCRIFSTFPVIDVSSSGFSTTTVAFFNVTKAQQNVWWQTFDTKIQIVCLSTYLDVCFSFQMESNHSISSYIHV